MERVISVRPLADDDRSWKEDALRRAWGDTLMARKDELIDTLDLDGFVAADGDERIGLLTYAPRGDEVEVASLQVDREGLGAGRALMDAVRARAEELGARRLWLITLNDNTRAIGFYQRWGMDLAALHRDGVTRARELKPSIPLTGARGVPLRHELEFELVLRPAGSLSGRA